MGIYPVPAARSRPPPLFDPLYSQPRPSPPPTSRQRIPGKQEGKGGPACASGRWMVPAPLSPPPLWALGEGGPRCFAAVIQQPAAAPQVDDGGWAAATRPPRPLVARPWPSPQPLFFGQFPRQLRRPPSAASAVAPTAARSTRCGGWWRRWRQRRLPPPPPTPRGGTIPRCAVTPRRPLHWRGAHRPWFPGPGQWGGGRWRYGGERSHPLRGTPPPSDPPPAAIAAYIMRCRPARPALQAGLARGGRRRGRRAGGAWGGCCGWRRGGRRAEGRGGAPRQPPPAPPGRRPDLGGRAGSG